MHSTVSELLQSYGYLLLFVFVGAESLGIPLPGETALVSAAALAALGALDIYAVIAVAAAGAIFGDNAGYWIGRKGGPAMIHRHSRFLHVDEAKVARVRAFFERHGARTIFIGRFIALLRTWAAVFAGVACMPYGVFMRYNALGGITWSILFGTLGYLFGRTLPRLERYIGQASLAAALLLLLAVLAVIFWRRFDAVAGALSRGAERLRRGIVQFPAVEHFRTRHPKLWAFASARLAAGEYLGLHLTIGLIVSLDALWLLGAVTVGVALALRRWWAQTSTGQSRRHLPAQASAPEPTQREATDDRVRPSHRHDHNREQERTEAGIGAERRGAYGHVCSMKCGRIEAVVCADAPPVEEEALWQSESMMCIERRRWFGSRPPAAPPGSQSRLVVPPPRLYIS